MVTNPCETLARILLQRHWMLATAESCTGGMIAARCTDLAGSSAWFERGFVTYSNDSKRELLGVPAQWIASQGAVSEAVARAMAQGAVSRSTAQVALAVTGIAGPSGGSADKPVGTVWFAWAWPGHLESECRHWPGDRHAVRSQTTAYALTQLIEKLERPVC